MTSRVSVYWLPLGAGGHVVRWNLLDLVPQAPPVTWGRDELGTGDMWNSNSLVAWLLARSGHDVTRIRPPAGGRLPGRRAGLVLAARQTLSTPRTAAPSRDGSRS